MTAKRTTRRAPTQRQGAQLARLIKSLGPLPRLESLEDVGLQLAVAQPRPFSGKGWLFELKYDGFRVLAGRHDGKDRLLYRRGTDASRLFPEIVAQLAHLEASSFILDGELVVPDSHGRPAFQKLLRRSGLSRSGDIARASRTSPSIYFAFDLLALNGQDLRALPLSTRKELLALFLGRRADRLRAVDHVEEQGEAFFEEVQRLGLEGMVAKRIDAPYREGRQSTWVKVALTETADFVIVGHAEGYQALHLALFDHRTLVYAGKVGAGIGPAQQALLEERLGALRREGPACGGDVPREKGTVWVDPTLVAEVRYKSWPEGLLPREPVFLRLRADKPIDDCVLVPRGTRAKSERSVVLTNEAKPFWPADGITKGDLWDYYRGVAPVLLPYLRDRPVLLARYPDGIAGKHFFQKNAPAYVPPFVRTVPAPGERGPVDQLVCDDERSLLYLVNLGTIALHAWASHVPSLDRPDWCVLDLDPKDAPFERVVELALEARALCERLELPSLVKTSGSSGLHVMVPLGAQVEFAGASALAALLAQHLARQRPELATLEHALARRRGRVYLDLSANARGRVLVSPYSVRPLPGAPVSTPLRWSEVGRRLRSSRQFTLGSLRARLDKLGADPMAPLLRLRPNLNAALEKLRDLLAG